MQAYKAVLGRLVDAAGLKHYTTCMVEEGVDRDELVMMLCRSHEFRQKQLDRCAHPPFSPLAWAMDRWQRYAMGHGL